ncbi:MAG: MFS transporter, partial [Actinomycetota bacterium]|nr:MFS transporter [Actinomycetota bacterium]
MSENRFHSADDTEQTGGAGAPIHYGAVEIRALAVLCMTFFLVALDNTIVNVALPTLQRTLGSSTTQLQWITDAYTTAFAGLIIVGGHLADRLGRREVLQSGLIAFIIGSAVALSAHSSDVIIGGRLVMGVGAALAVPASLSMLIDVFPTPSQRRTAIAGWTASAGLGVALGPLVGGALLTQFWWGSIFVANMAVAGLALLASGLLLPRSPSHRLHALDWMGSALSVVALSCLVAGIIQAPSWGWADLRTLFLFAVAIAAGLLFVRRAMTAESGIVHFSVFRSRHFSLSSLAMGTIYLG